MMATMWESYREIRKRALQYHNKDDLIEMIMEMEKILAKVTNREESGQLKNKDGEKE